MDLAIGRRCSNLFALLAKNFQHLHQMPLGATKIVGFPVENDAVGNKVEVVVPTSDALVTRLQQVLMLVHHSQTECTIHADYELGQCHGSR